MAMASSSQSYFSRRSNGATSSGKQSPWEAAIEDDSDNNDDPVAEHTHDRALLADDPLADEGEETLSHYRQQKQTTGQRLRSAFPGTSATSPRSRTPTSNKNRVQETYVEETVGNGTSGKDGGALDWYVEGPGRRVGYEDMTAIDWIFEYTKERQRLRKLYSNAAGLVGYALRVLDASQIWIVLILTGIAAGAFAAAIDVATDWLADLKTGYCSAGTDGGRFHLSKAFCCYGYDGSAQCQDWVSWSRALHVRSAGGTWVVEYLFFLLFSVSNRKACIGYLSDEDIGIICGSRKSFGEGVCSVCQA